MSSFVAFAQDYTLLIEKGVVMKDNENAYRVIPINIQNNTNDTLRYFSMSCSWQEFFYINNETAHLRGDDCDKNIPIVKTIYPLASERILIRFKVSKKVSLYKPKFRIGFHLIKVESNQDLIKTFIEMVNGSPKRIIWSNELPFVLEQ